MRPDSVIEFLLGDQAARIGGEEFKNLKGLRSQLDILIACSQVPAREIKRKPVEIQDASNCDVQHSASSSEDYPKIQKSFIARSGPHRNLVGHTWIRQKLGVRQNLGLDGQRHTGSGSKS